LLDLAERVAQLEVTFEGKPHEPTYANSPARKTNVAASEARRFA
jgi:hypothetical protein